MVISASELYRKTLGQCEGRGALCWAGRRWRLIGVVQPQISETVIDLQPVL